MNRRRYLLHVAALTATLLLVVTVAAIAASAPRISTDELKARLGETNLVILDARSPWDWGKSNVKILGSERVDPGSVPQWVPNYSKEKTYVLYCA